MAAKKEVQATKLPRFKESRGKRLVPKTTEGEIGFLFGRGEAPRGAQEDWFRHEGGEKGSHGGDRGCHSGNLKGARRDVLMRGLKGQH